MSNAILDLLTRSWESEVNSPALHFQSPPVPQSDERGLRTKGAAASQPATEPTVPSLFTSCSNKLVTMQQQEPPRTGNMAVTFSSRCSLPSSWASSTQRKTCHVVARPASAYSPPVTTARENWWCNSCRRPREECECLCVIS